MFWQNSNCRWMKTCNSSILEEFLCACSRKLLGLVWLLLRQLLLFPPGVCAIISWRLPSQVYFFVMCSMQSCTSVETRSIANWFVYMLPCAFSKAEKPSSAICVIVEQKLCGCLINGMSFWSIWSIPTSDSWDADMTSWMSKAMAMGVGAIISFRVQRRLQL